MIMPDGTINMASAQKPRQRVCDVEDGLTLEALLARSEAIVERSATQWRLGALFELSQAWEADDVIHRDPADILSALPTFFDLARTIGDEANVLGFSGIRDVAADFNAFLQRLDAGAVDPETALALIADLANSIDRFQRAVAAGVRG